MNKSEIINRVVTKERFFAKRPTKWQKLVAAPFYSTFYYSLVLLSKFQPLWVSKKTIWGEKMSYFLPEGNQIFYYGFYEANLTNFIIRFLREGDQFIDIGANIGFYTLLSSQLVGTGGRVISFEPTPRTFKTLKINADKKSNILCINKALSDKKTTLKIKDYGLKFSGTNSINPLPKEVSDFIKTKGEEINIESDTLDNIVSQYGLRPSLLKIDTEGHESLVLKGGLETLKIIRPVLSVEMCKHPEWYENVLRSFKLMEEFNYSPYEVSLDGYLSPSSAKTYRDINLVFVPKEKEAGMSHLIKDAQYHL